MFEESLGPRTRFDLNFRLGDVPVRVHPFFWLSAVLLGLSVRAEGLRWLGYLLSWVAVLFVSILIHELGHIMMGRRFGARGHILLTGFCGLAIGSAEQRERWQRILVLLAGPGAGFLFAALVTGFLWLYSPRFTLALLGDWVGVVVELGPEVPRPSRHVLFVVDNLLRINLLWGLVNLTPIWPLDGGQISRELCQKHRGREGTSLSLKISLGTAAALAAVALLEWIKVDWLKAGALVPSLPFLSLGASLFPVLFFTLLAVQSYQLLQFVKRGGLDWQDQQDEPRAPWEQDADWWKRGDSPWRD